MKGGGKLKKYTCKDVHIWEVVNYGGTRLPYTTTKENGKEVTILTYSGFKSAKAVADKLGGVARRA